MAAGLTVLIERRVCAELLVWVASQSLCRLQTSEGGEEEKKLTFKATPTVATVATAFVRTRAPLNGGASVEMAGLDGSWRVRMSTALDRN
jgi:hypothetical protein